jgi:hypothetical protein
MPTKVAFRYVRSRAKYVRTHAPRAGVYEVRAGTCGHVRHVRGFTKYVPTRASTCGHVPRHVPTCGTYQPGTCRVYVPRAGTCGHVPRLTKHVPTRAGTCRHMPEFTKYVRTRAGTCRHMPRSAKHVPTRAGTCRHVPTCGTWLRSHMTSLRTMRSHVRARAEVYETRADTCRYVPAVAGPLEIPGMISKKCVLDGCMTDNHNISVLSASCDFWGSVAIQSVRASGCPLTDGSTRWPATFADRKSLRSVAGHAGHMI